MAKFVDPSNPENVVEVPDEFTLEVDKVNGETKNWSLSDTINNARAGAVSTQRFQEASEMKRTAEEVQQELQQKEEELEGLREKAELADLMVRAKDDDQAFLEFAQKVGYTQEQAEQQLEAARASGRRPNSTNQDTPPQEGGREGDDDMALTEEQKKELKAELLKELGVDSPNEFSAIKQATLEAKQREVMADARQALDNDPQLGKMTDGQKKYLVENAMFPAILDRLQSGNEAYGPQVALASLEAAKKTASELGITPKPASEASKDETESSKQKMQMAAESVGPVEQPVQEAIEAGKLPEKPKMSDPQYSSKMTQRQLMMRAQQGSPGSSAERSE